MSFARSRVVLRVALREARILRRSRAGRSVAVLVFALAWLPPVLVSARSGRLGLASFDETAPLTLALAGVLVPLLALLAGCASFATEIDDRTIVPLLAAPVSRFACVQGKLAGLGASLAVVYAAAFASTGVAVGAVRGLSGSSNCVAVFVSGALLGACCLLVGAVFGATQNGRVRAYGATLLTWLVLVFALDAVLLALVLATSPPPPASVGHHGHDEIAATSSSESVSGPNIIWMAAGPVDLFRLSAFALDPDLGARWPGFNDVDGVEIRTVLATGWLVWLVLPAAVVHYRFRRVALT